MEYYTAGASGYQTHTPLFSLLTRSRFQRVSCHYLVSPIEEWLQTTSLVDPCAFFSPLEVPILPRTDACTAYQGPDSV